MDNRCSRSIARTIARAMMGTLLMFGAEVQAGYDADATGVITELLAYDSSGYFFIKLSNQPASHPACDPAYFAVDAAGTSEARAQLYARALLAYATQTPVTIGYDSQGNCAVARIRIYRIG